MPTEVMWQPWKEPRFCSKNKTTPAARRVIFNQSGSDDEASARGSGEYYGGPYMELKIGIGGILIDLGAAAGGGVFVIQISLV